MKLPLNNWLLQSTVKIDSHDKKATLKIIAELLKNRGLTDKKKIEEFYDAGTESVNFKNLKINSKQADKAVIRIKKAIKNKESVVVYTDYDVDGIVSGAILWECLHKLKVSVMPYVPDRQTEGYGLSNLGIDNAYAKFKPQLLICVDHGVTAEKQINYAKKLGIETVIIDHHLLPEKPPPAHALVHTTLLCASGLTWIFCRYLLKKLRKEVSENDLDLVALATVADLVPLTGANRILVKKGLVMINKTKRPGLVSLIEIAGLKKGEITEYHLGHILAPRINAIGRLHHALDALRLLCQKDEEKVKILAQKLDDINRNRQVLTVNSFMEADSGENYLKQKIIIVSGEQYHQGVIGLIAGRLTEAYHRPAIVIAETQALCKASARSIKGVNIVTLLKKTGTLLEDIGGHPMAAGFTIAKKNLDKFKKAVNLLADEEIDEEMFIKKLTVDLKIPLECLTRELSAQLNLMSPFGKDNPLPLFLSEKVRLAGYKVIGREAKHLKMTLGFDDDRGGYLSALAFNRSDFAVNLMPGTLLDIVYNLQEDRWNGKNDLILKVRDVRLAPPKAGLIPA